MKKYFNKFLFSLIIIFSIFFIASCNNEDENVASSSEIRENKYSVLLDNRLENDNIEIKTKYVKMNNGIPSSVIIDYSSKYDEGTKIYVNVKNNSNEKIIVKAIISDTVLDYCIIDSANSNELIGLELEGDMTILVDLAPSLAHFTINFDKSKNSSSAINRLFVYDPDDANRADYSDDSDVLIGKNVAIYEFNYASSVHLTIVHNGKKIVDKYYSKVIDQEAGHDEKFIFEIEGDLIVTEEAIDQIPIDGFVKINLTGDNIGRFSIGMSDFYDSEYVEKGTFKVTITNLNKTNSIKATVKIGDNVVIDDVIEKKKDKEYPNITFNTNVLVTFSLVE